MRDDIHVTPWKYGRMLTHAHDKGVGRSIELLGEYCEAELDVLRAITKPDSIVADIGANIGALTIPWSMHVRHVWALEPVPYLYNMLCGNLALNDIRNVAPLPVAASDSHGRMSYPDINWDVENSFGSGSLEPFNGACTCQTLPFGVPVTAMKIDVEGHELEVLQGAKQMIDQHRPFIFMENDRREKSDTLISYLTDVLGYKCFWHVAPYYRPDNFNGYIGETPFNPPGRVICGLNMLCLPPGKHTELPEELRPARVGEWIEDVLNGRV